MTPVTAALYSDLYTLSLICWPVHFFCTGSVRCCCCRPEQVLLWICGSLSVFSKALWWLRIPSLCLQPRLFWWGEDVPGTSDQTAAAGRHEEKHRSYFNFHFVTVYQSRINSAGPELFRGVFQMYLHTSVISADIQMLPPKRRIKNSRQWSETFLTPISRQWQRAGSHYKADDSCSWRGLHRISKHDTTSQLSVPP